MDPMLSLPDRRQVPLSDVLRNRESRAYYLAPFYREQARVQCMCRAAGVPMGIGRREEPRETFYVYPLHRADPPRHLLLCPHHKLPSGDQVNGQRPLLELSKDRNKLVVNVPIPLYQGEPGARADAAETEAAVTEPEPETPSPATAPPGTLATLLEVLLTEAELNCWHQGFSGRRNYGVFYKRIREAADTLQLRRTDFAPLFHVAPPYSPEREEEGRAQRSAFLAALEQRPNKRRYYGYVLGIVRDADCGHHDSVALRLMHNPMALHFDAPMWQAHGAPWFPADIVERETVEPYVVLARVERREGREFPWLYVHDMVAMRLTDTKSFIPVGNDRERDLANRLVGACRAFRKPLAIEMADFEPVPAFVLEDRDDRIHLELFDSGNLAQSAQRHEREGWYTQSGQAVWWWDCAARSEPPPLPSANA